MQTESALRRIAHELVEDAARESIHHLEVRFCPALHTAAGLTPEQVLGAVREGLEEGQRKYEVSYGMIVSGLRERGGEASLAMARLAAEWRDRRVVAFDLAGPEVGFPARDHAEAIRSAKAAGLHLTLHAGEVTDAAAVVDALERGADRIGHGVHLRDDPGLLDAFAERGVALEMCPSSNVQTRSVASYEDHPIVDFHRRGIPVTVNTDSRLVSLTTVTDEFLHLREHHALTWDEVVELCKNSFRYAFLSEPKREELVARVDTVAAKLVAAGFSPDEQRPSDGSK